MAPLVQGGFPAVAGLAGLGVNVPAVVDPVGVPSECLLLKNMFDPSTEVGVNIFLVCFTVLYHKLIRLYACICLVQTELNFDEDIEEDVRDECSKFGKLNHIFVDK